MVPRSGDESGLGAGAGGIQQWFPRSGDESLPGYADEIIALVVPRSGDESVMSITRSIQPWLNNGFGGCGHSSSAPNSSSTSSRDSRCAYASLRAFQSVEDGYILLRYSASTRSRRDVSGMP